MAFLVDWESNAIQPTITHGFQPPEATKDDAWLLLVMIVTDMWPIWGHADDQLFDVFIQSRRKVPQQQPTVGDKAATKMS